MRPDEARQASPLRWPSGRVLGEQRLPLRLAELSPGRYVLVGLDGDVAEVGPDALDLADVDVLVGRPGRRVEGDRPTGSHDRCRLQGADQLLAIAGVAVQLLQRRYQQAVLRIAGV